MVPSVLRIAAELTLLAFTVSIIVYWPELFPRCRLCHRVKPRFRFLLHKDISLALWRKGNHSLCKKCGAKENIHTFADLNRYLEIKKRMEYQTKSTSWETPPHS